VILNLSTGVYYSMPGSGALVWELLEAGADVGGIAEELAARYDAPIDEVRADVERFVDALLAEGMIEQANRVAPPTGMPSGGPATEAYTAPAVEKFTDLGDLIALDPPMPGLKDITGPSPEG
jgi:hypothetical protein